ncbi:MAG: hypothetical protein JWP38_1087 [Herbaspirillum sp.]|jgi:hypothetical protein|nr:hypothetical protein [Herbaspirillum sp.]
MEKNDKRQQLIIKMLAFNDAASHADAVARAEDIWGRLATHLSQLIGETGFNALYGRSVRLVLVQFDWLTMPKSSQSPGTLFTTLKNNLLSVDAASANDANIALLDTFTKLLSGLIGEALTTRLLHTALADEPEEKLK